MPPCASLSSGPPPNLVPSRNRLLAALPAGLARRLQQQMEPVTLALRMILYEPGTLITRVHFPDTAVISLLTLFEDGPSVEAALVGRDGMCGLPIFLGAESDATQALVQVPGSALRMTAQRFRGAVDNEPLLRDVLGRYTQILLAQMAQSAACNRLHPIHERCARWLLQTHDRVDEAEFPLTQEFLATMLGVRRAGVTVAAGMLQQAGFIRYGRGRLAVLDRDGLEGSACECYRPIVNVTNRLLPAGPPPG